MVISLGLAGCGGASPGRGFQSPTPAGQTRALTDPSLLDDRSTIPDRIRLLDSDDPLVRLLAIETLTRMTGQTFGYDYASSRIERDQAVARWVEWYELERSSQAPADGIDSETP